ncbi:MAG: division/cell wall cluster transcriptional repressor MraZ [Lachnospiraceae bacterium]|jgi:mraZ protein|nr:division/cell wall cluster transcriptional repressor MraZ [Lachnospiraceae bacterium]MBR3637653.1 division/cell wall cluster transcriptional repressor MraZ [Lachnospiraceae bacterium]
MSFKSEYNHTIDPKGRLVIPTKFRPGLGNSFVITKGIDKCLYFYPVDAWEEMEDKLAKIPLTNKAGRTFARFMIGGAAEVDMDAQGRILLPAYLREYAEIIKDTVMIGMVNHVELWAKELRDAASEDVDINEIAESLDGLGI